MLCNLGKLISTTFVHDLPESGITDHLGTLMPKFLFLQRGGCDNQPEMTEEQKQQRMQSCMQWMTSGQQEGWLLDPGAPLMGGSIVDTDSVTDGPVTDGPVVGGYTMVEAADLAAACELAKKTIQMTGAGPIEVREVASMG